MKRSGPGSGQTTEMVCTSKTRKALGSLCVRKVRPHVLPDLTEEPEGDVRKGGVEESEGGAVQIK